jgi:hypothetical protein
VALEPAADTSADAMGDRHRRMSKRGARAPRPVRKYSACADQWIRSHGRRHHIRNRPGHRGVAVLAVRDPPAARSPRPRMRLSPLGADGYGVHAHVSGRIFSNRVAWRRPSDHGVALLVLALAFRLAAAGLRIDKGRKIRVGPSSSVIAPCDCPKRRARCCARRRADPAHDRRPRLPAGVVRGDD